MLPSGVPKGSQQGVPPKVILHQRSNMYLGPCPNGRALWKTEYVIHIHGPHPYQSYYVHAERKKEWGERERERERESFTRRNLENQCLLQ